MQNKQLAILAIKEYLYKHTQGRTDATVACRNVQSLRATVAQQQQQLAVYETALKALLNILAPDNK